MDGKHEVNPDDKVPTSEDTSCSPAIEQAQEDSADERQKEGGYGG